MDPSGSRREHLVDVMLEFARTGTGDFQVDDILTQLCRSAGRVLDVAGAGVMVHRDGRSTYVHATTDETARLERLQGLLQQGPCVEALTTQALVEVHDLRASARWPELSQAAGEAGLQAAFSLPLLARGQSWGALDLYRDRPGPLSEQELEAAQALADVATSYVVMASDRDVAQQAQAELAYRALHDPLTGLANRALLLDRLNHALQVARRTGTSVGVLFIDLDDFKAVNDTLGHAVGDRLLSEVALRLSRALRAGDTLARTGGDEFVVLCEDLVEGTVHRVLEGVTRRIRGALASPTRIGSVDLAVHASIGAAVATGSDGADAVLKAADAAMYEDKRGRRDAGHPPPDAQVPPPPAHSASVQDSPVQDTPLQGAPAQGGRAP